MDDPMLKLKPGDIISDHCDLKWKFHSVNENHNPMGYRQLKSGRFSSKLEEIYDTRPESLDGLFTMENKEK